jgi:O-antigen ligase
MAVRPGRLALWGAALRMVGERPLLGVGPDNYRLLYGRYSTIGVADPRVHSNNMYLEVLAGMGFIGGVALLWLGAISAQGIRRAARAGGVGLGVAAAGVAIAVHGLVDSFIAFTGTYILFALTLGLASAYERDGRRHAHRV